MGTRGALGFYRNGEHKVTYNHFDSYPSALGDSVLKYAAAHTIEELNKIFDSIQMVEEGSTPTEDQIEKCRKYLNKTVGKQSEGDWYCLLRDAQGDLEAYGEVGLMIDDKEFLNNSLFCEYAYIINLSDNTLEVYRGFQKSRPKGRYSDFTPEREYYAVGLVNTFRLDDLPNDYRALVPEEPEE